MSRRWPCATSPSLNPVDFKLRGGMYRWIRKPTLPAITGKDFAGRVSVVGAGVAGFSVGQRVFGSVNPIAHLARGQTMLVSGASGGVGSSAVQIARSIGARITGVCSTSNIDYVRSFGAAEVVDYKSTDWRSARSCSRALPRQRACKTCRQRSAR